MARWPSPPTPWVTTRSPGVAPQLHSALKVVTPAHNNGADSTALSSSGTWASAEHRPACASYTAVAGDAGDRGHCLARERLAAAAAGAVPARTTEPTDTPTRMPTSQPSTSGPIASTMPITSWPGTRG